jgi:hypothetical protein
MLKVPLMATATDEAKHSANTCNQVAFSYLLKAKLVDGAICSASATHLDTDIDNCITQNKFAKCTMCEYLTAKCSRKG